MKTGIKLLLIIVLIIVLSTGYDYYHNLKTSNDMRVGCLPSDHSASLFVSDARGSFEDAGLEVKTIQMSSGPDIVNAVSSGDLDVAYVGITPALKAISQGAPIKVVGAVNLEGSGIVVGKNSNIKSPADLKGRKVATPGVGSIQYLLLLYELEKYNLTSKQVDIISMNVYIIPQSLAGNQIDAYISYEPFVTLARYQNIGNVLLYSGEIIEEHPCCVIISNENYIEDHPQQLEAFLRVHEQSTEYVKSHPNETARYVSQNINSNLQVEQIALQHIIFVSKLDPAFQDNVLRFMQIEYQMGFLGSTLTPEEIFDTTFL